MIVECESCGTRFNLADAQVPAQGARVRCSKCHHRFHVMPASSAPDSPSPPEGEPSAAAPPEPTPERDGDDPDLDNPEFLFEGSAGAEPAAGPGVAAEQLGTGGEDLGSDDDETLFGLEDEPREVRREVFGFGEADELTSDPDESAERGEAGPSEVTRVAAEAPAPAADEDGDLFGAFDTDEAEVQIDAWGGSGDSAPEVEAAPPVPSREHVATAPPATAAPRAPAAAAPTSAEIDSLGSRMAGGAVRAAAWLVGVALVAGGLRVLAGHGVGPPPGPGVIHAHGWTASAIEARYEHDAGGRPVLVVQGDLEAGGSTPAPRVRASLLDAQGGVVLESDDAIRERLDAGALAGLLEEDAEPPPTTGARTTGFTLIVPEPPHAARRFRLELLPAGSDS